jgi:integrase
MTTTWVEALLRKQRETREHGVSPFPYQAAFLLDNPLRRTFFKPARVVESIGLTGSERCWNSDPGRASTAWRSLVASAAADSTCSTVRGQIADLPEGFSFHDLRHYLASLLIASGADIKTAQARMRHATARTTLDTYGHLWPDADESTRTAVGAVIADRLTTAAVPLRSEAPNA